ncbi:NUDIX domain-containing protein [Patescibacteria group bacterium]|nr:NUDIX domain-containing protein [Patescibacteria group bacterium]MBU1931443.1 NUDIX domain-containing protein [Patescibacteria group bacterium]
MEITRHFTATTVIIYKNKVLLHLHKKLGIWLPVGGHIDRDELPQEAALREIKEEAGLDVELYSADKKIDFGNAKQLMRPVHIILEDINEFHQHIDFIYYANANTFRLNPEDGEVSDLKWFTEDELEKVKMPVNVKELSLEALRILGKAN